MLNRLHFVIVFLFFISVSFAQNVIRIELTSVPERTGNQSVYIAGSFNGWNPAADKYQLQKQTNGKYVAQLKLENGSYEYKITRGGWDKVECKKGGAGIANRMLKVESGIAIQITVEEWADNIPAKPKISTASRQVKVIDSAFLIPQLNRTRRIWIYLPANYTTSKLRYPVLYIHDGQNVFEDTTAFSGEWGVDEFLDSARLKQCIVVAIDNGANKRINEYCPYDMERFGTGEGNQYIDFLAKTLKPYIDKKYRTLRSRQNTFMAGSSMGGLISIYAILKYPKVYGGAGVFSPAFWVAPKIFDEIKSRGKKVKGKIYFYAGKQEGETMVPYMLKALELLATISKSKTTTVIRNDGKHNEATWRKEFPLFYEWIIK